MAVTKLFMPALFNRGRPLYFCPVVSSFVLSFFYLFCSPILSRRTLDVYHTSTHGVAALSANLECMSETCFTQLSGNVGPKKSPKSRHLGTIAQLCRVISSQLTHVSTIGKKLVKQQYLHHMSLQYRELRPASG